MLLGKRPWSVLGGAFSLIILFYLVSLRRLDFAQSSFFPKTSVVEDGLPAVPRLRQDAYRIRTAELFLEHFDNLTRMPGMTMAEAKAGCTWTDAEMESIDFQFGNTSSWGVNLDWVTDEVDDHELAIHRTQMYDYILNDMIPYNKPFGSNGGRGIVIVGGNRNGQKRIRTILRTLSKLGSKLPVELHYWGVEEISPETQQDLAAVGPRMYFNDLASPSNVLQSYHAEFLHTNYQLKTAGILNSRFDEILLLDSDNIPVIDPEELFESEVYKKYGSVFWPDIARTRPNNPIWAITNTKCRIDEYEQESGQLLVDKRQFWYHLQLANWFNSAEVNKAKDGGEYYYNNFLLGDKDLFRFAWHALKTPYGYPSRWLTSVGTLSPDGSFYCGHTFAQYHPDHADGRVAFLHGGLLKTMKKPVFEWQRGRQGGVFQAHKTSRLGAEDHSYVENVGIKFDGASYLPNELRPDGMQAAWCTDMGNTDARPFDELIPNFNVIFEEIGGYWQLDEGYEWSDF